MNKLVVWFPFTRDIYYRSFGEIHIPNKIILKYLISAISLLLNIFLFGQGKYLETVKINDSIYVFKPKIDWTHGNGVAILGKDGVFFIDTYIQSNYAAEAIRKLKKITRLPVKYVLNTHWHYDHVTGNYEFKKAFPGCQFIMHDSTFPYMIKRVTPYIEKELESTRQSAGQLEKELRERRTGNGSVLTENMVPFWNLMLREAKEYIKQFKPNQMVNADITFNDSLNFHWGTMTLNLVYANDNGHSSGDVIVWIPEKKIILTGDIVVAPTPYATYFNIPGMVKSIQRVIDLNPSIIIPGHGVVEYDLSYVQLLKQAFDSYINETENAIAKGISLEEARNSIKLSEIDKQFTGDDDVKKWAYRSFFVLNLIRNVYRMHGLIPQTK